MSARERAERGRLGGLIGLNLAALVALGYVTFSPSADAQRQRVSRPRGDYAMVAARAQGIPESALYIVDASNQQMLVLRYDRSSKSLKFLGFRDLEADGREAAGRGR